MVVATLRHVYNPPLLVAREKQYHGRVLFGRYEASWKEYPGPRRSPSRVRVKAERWVLREEIAYPSWVHDVDEVTTKQLLEYDHRVHPLV
jgi:hypothetical protein